MKDNMFEKPKAGKLAVGKEKPETESHLAQLWRSYRFSGQPPKEGSPVAVRLQETCEAYLKFMVKHAKDGETSSENKVYKAHASDAYHRELHNQIALMTTGKQRSDMDTRQAEMVANFACELVFHCTFDQMPDMP